MKMNRYLGGMFALLFSCAMVSKVDAEVKMPAIFADNMVMQQQTNANLWGTATPNKRVTVTPSWNHKTYTTTSDASGNWKLAIPTPVAGGPYEIVVSDGNALTLKNVMLGGFGFVPDRVIWKCQ